MPTRFGARDLGDRTGDRERKPQAVGDRAAIVIRAAVDAVAHELIQQVVVGGMDFHAVESGVLRVGRGTAVVLEDAGDFARVQRARRQVVLQALSGECLALRLDRGGRHRQHAARLKVGMRQPSGVPQLKHHDAAGLMHGPRNVPPGRDLRIRPDPRGIFVSARLRRDVCCLRNNQPGGRSLRIILRREIRRHAFHARSAARQGRHHDAVAKLKRA